jgi:putative ATP-dependent DNA ligase
MGASAGLRCRQAVPGALTQGTAERIQLGRWAYVRFAAPHRGIPRGTAVFADAVIWGYPEIGRLLRLDSGLRRQFRAPFWVEEKVDGYNVRLFQAQGDVLALTRRGYLCPFTTDRLPDLLDLRVFAERPDLVLCAEVAGPDNPYTESSPPYVTEDVRLFVFDVMRKDAPQLLPQAERLQLLQAYGLPGVPQYGRYEVGDVEALKALLRRLDAEGREGVVLKEDGPEPRRAKYVTGSTTLRDLQTTAAAMAQLPPEYYTQRLLRLALFLDEHDMAGRRQLAGALGEGLIEGLLQAVRQYRHHGKVLRTFRCRFRQEANAALFTRSLRRLLGEAQVQLRGLRQEGAFYVLEFDKILPRATGVFAQLLGGGLVFD